MKCPQCNIENPDDAIRCDCGYDFIEMKKMGTLLSQKEIERKTSWRLGRVIFFKIGIYLGIVVGGVCLFLSMSPIFGYLGYSDRPGPGWKAGFFQISWKDFLANAQFSFSFGIFMALYAVPIGLFLLGLSSILRKPRISRIFSAIICGLISAILSAYMVASIGWYIALGDVAVNVALVLGLIYGLVFLPFKSEKKIKAATVPGTNNEREV